MPYSHRHLPCPRDLACYPAKSPTSPRTPTQQSTPRFPIATGIEVVELSCETITLS